MNRNGVSVTMLVTLFAVPMLASAASGECAWALWGRLDAPDAPEPWRVVTRFGGRDDCIRELGQRSANWKSGEWRVTFNGDSRVAAASDAGVRELVCLPDTVDPRGPKAGTK